MPHTPKHTKTHCCLAFPEFPPPSSLFLYLPLSVGLFGAEVSFALENRYRFGVVAMGFSLEIFAARAIFTAGGSKTFSVPFLVELLTSIGNAAEDAALAGQVHTVPHVLRACLIDYLWCSLIMCVRGGGGGGGGGGGVGVGW